MPREILFAIMYCLAMLSVALALYFIKDKRQRMIVLTPVVLAILLHFLKGVLY
ncbi:hypothetical protein LVB77_15915 [Lysobacter sp. 5GHs7-4]|uniref:hypothetical protein n=1 Tax=Lysobacter sp. 5GHs7-4 TaxID=2904253 RepID=UPI001E513A74|nr:hypothetical protein [Lysobacter sp. 5GHs7-4]UHQ22139.1 hypothetical protein LVB77_15915 [Lysobacter sp. 5GHs7-4]